jgi:prepilin-type N-terminal cleavage/methylation domain-containing protein
MKSEKGFSLIEVVIAVALLGIVAIAILLALATGSKAIFIADEQATAESLARTEMEYVRNQEYSGAPWAYELPSASPPADPPTWWDPADPHTLPDGYDGYTVNVSVGTVPLHALDDGIQKITVLVYHPYDKMIIKLDGYRSFRG